MMNKLIKLITP